MSEWLELTLKAGELSSDKLDEALIEVGAIAVTLSDAKDTPVLEPLPGETPLWPETLVTGLFEMPCDEDVLKQQLLALLNVKELPLIKSNDLQDQDWVRSWMDHYHPMKFGEHLWICPTHLEPPEPNITTVMLDPGLAFGTGTHPTTALCLEWLSNHNKIIKGHTVIDYGCGSGILGIAAKLLGAQDCYSTDIDPQAIDATLINAQRNNVTLHCVLPQEFNPPLAHIVMANILAGPIVALAPLLASFTHNQGHLILAGILESDTQYVKDAYAPWFIFQEPIRNIDGWICLHGIKNA